MKVAAVVSTKGGPGKTTVGANLGAFCADAGVRTLLIDLDNQPSLSSFYNLSHEAPGGTYQLITSNETRPDQIISQTIIPNLSLIKSNDPFNLLSNLLLHAADGRLRLKNLMPAFAQDFDLILIDTQGARSIVLEMALLGSQVATGVPSGLDALDQVTGGFQDADLIVIAARPSMGKTSLALSLVDAALQQKPTNTVQIYSQEMPAHTLSGKTRSRSTKRSVQT